MRYASIRNLDVSNGENIGVSLFTQGCDRKPHCKNCFNSETWNFNGGKEWTEEAKNKFMELIDRPYIRRISILGGEPLAEQNLDDVLSLVQQIRISFPEKTIWLYTGYNFDLLKSQYDEYKYTPFAANADEWLTRWEIISNIDVLVDGEYIDEQKDLALKFRGSKNQHVIDVKQSLSQKKMVLYCE